MKSAQALGIPVGFPVFSWDNLTTKGIIHVAPGSGLRLERRSEARGDRVLRHPSGQHRHHRGAAIRFLHRVDSRRSTAAATARGSRESIRRRPSSPISARRSSSPATRWHSWKRWIEELRSDPRLAARATSSFARIRGRSVSGARLMSPGTVASRSSMSRMLNADQSLYDALHHSAAVVGLNTSAQIEAGDPRQARADPARARVRAGAAGHAALPLSACASRVGSSRSRRDLDEHRNHLARRRWPVHYDVNEIRRAVERFIRPDGWHRPATPILAEAIVRLAPERPSAVRRWFGSSARSTGSTA